MESKSIQGKTIAILVADGFNDYLYNTTRRALEEAGAFIRVVSSRSGIILAGEGKNIQVDYLLGITTPDAFDALYIPGGKKSIEYMSSQKEALRFVCCIYIAGKNIAVDDESIALLGTACLNKKLSSLTNIELEENGIFVHSNATPAVNGFIKAIAADCNLPDFSKELSMQRMTA